MALVDKCFSHCTFLFIRAGESGVILTPLSSEMLVDVKELRNHFCPGVRAPHSPQLFLFLLSFVSIAAATAIMSGGLSFPSAHCLCHIKLREDFEVVSLGSFMDEVLFAAFARR